MMNRSVCGGGSMAGQPGALENVKYMTSMEFQNSRLPTAGQDIGNRNKVRVTVYFHFKTDSIFLTSENAYALWLGQHVLKM